MRQIENGGDLVKRFGFFPTFHDAELLSVTLDRDTLSASFRILIPEFVGGRLKNNVEVTLTFLDIQKFTFEGFNYQNVLSSLSFDDAVENDEITGQEGRFIRVTMDTLFGAWSTFLCSRVCIDQIADSELAGGDPPYLKRKRPALPPKTS